MNTRSVRSVFTNSEFKTNRSKGWWEQSGHTKKNLGTPKLSKMLQDISGNKHKKSTVDVGTSAKNGVNYKLYLIHEKDYFAEYVC